MRHAGRVAPDLPTGVPFVNRDGVTGLIVPAGRRRRAGIGPASLLARRRAARAPGRAGARARPGRVHDRAHGRRARSPSTMRRSPGRTARAATDVTQPLHRPLACSSTPSRTTPRSLAGVPHPVPRLPAADVQPQPVPARWRRCSRSSSPGAAYVYGLYEPERIEGFWPVRPAAAAVASTLAFLLTLGVLQLVGRRVRRVPAPRHPARVAAADPRARRVAHRRRSRLTPIRWPEQRVLIVGHRRARGRARRRADRARASGATASSGSSRATRTCARATRRTGAPPVLGTVHDAPSARAGERGRPRHRRLAGRAARARRGHHAQRRGGRARRRRAGALRDLHRRGRQHRRRHPAHGDHAPLTPVVRRAPSASSTCVFSLLLLVVLSPVLLLAAARRPPVAWGGRSSSFRSASART